MFHQDFAHPFERVMGCSPAELLSWLPRSLPEAILDIGGAAEVGRCRATFEDGQLLIEWRVLDPRGIALLTIPQLVLLLVGAALTAFDYPAAKRAA